jgi:glutathione S-transferase
LAPARGCREKVPDSAIKFYEGRFVNLWRFADEQLAKTPYLAGGEITAAIYAGRKALPDNAGLKHLQAWGERIGSRPGVEKGMKLEN